jgi:hypothetical protein
MVAEPKPLEQGAPRAAYDDGEWFRVPRELVERVGHDAALLFGRIAWRSEATGTWRATRGELAAETLLSPHRVRVALDRLRAEGWLLSERTSTLDATQVWRPIWLIGAGQSESVGATTPRLRVVHGPLVESTLSSLHDSETTTTPPSPPPTEALFEAPAAPVEPPHSRAENVQPGAEQGPPKTAQTLVARWCDGFRASHNGHDAPKAFMGRVAGQARNLAKACGEDHGEWVGAYNASYAAGQASAWDLTRYLVPVARSTTARRNVFADQAMGGPSPQEAQALASSWGLGGGPLELEGGAR